MKLTYSLMGLVMTISIAIATTDETDVVVVKDTCALCKYASRDSNPLRRFKACELLSIQNAFKKCLKQVKRLEKETSEQFSIKLDHPTVDVSTFLPADELLNSTYERLQKILLLEQIAVRFNTEYYLRLPVGGISKHILQLMCQIEPILRSGQFNSHHIFEDRCIASERIPYVNFDRTGGINSVVSFINISTLLMKTTVGNIHHILHKL